MANTHTHTHMETINVNLIIDDQWNFSNFAVIPPFFSYKIHRTDLDNKTEKKIKSN